MSNVEDILAYAWNKDSVNLKPALDAEMQSRISDRLQNMYTDVSASLFGSTSGEVENDISQSEELEDSIEGTNNEDA